MIDFFAGGFAEGLPKLLAGRAGFRGLSWRKNLAPGAIFYEVAMQKENYFF
ncbi:hypothetical protein [Deinococcus arcticus]|uniref:hypothetical protein n=1 Tax=Deinococcus arcticus TaxID=2136176 RepID=UPI0013047D0D|nr:hypothetical protein [Deinococcus arcticus]